MRELIALLNTVNRVRGASMRLTPEVAAAYRPKLAYIANAYRVATTAVVARIRVRARVRVRVRVRVRGRPNPP